ncbi:hypothetical protein SAMN05443244_0927 [Terriglobus roseus]|uniref:Uncharacterized protein n=1 Tax=Terriglobus roseus TaxID=392734 RepID=A0A1H4K0D8_9BACT|nr:hypothetical protein SAMN05443244_0927 [Terriglobus roseus]
MPVGPRPAPVSTALRAGLGSTTALKCHVYGSVEPAGQILARHVMPSTPTSWEGRTRRGRIAFAMLIHRIVRSARGQCRHQRRMPSGHHPDGSGGQTSTWLSTRRHSAMPGPSSSSTNGNIGQWRNSTRGPRNGAEKGRALAGGSKQRCSIVCTCDFCGRRKTGSSVLTNLTGVPTCKSSRFGPQSS